MSNPRILVERMPLRLAVTNNVPGALHALLTAHHVAKGGYSEEGNCCALCAGGWSLARAPVHFVLGRKVDPDLDEALVLLICEGCSFTANSSTALLGVLERRFGWTGFAPLPVGGRA